MPSSRGLRLVLATLIALVAALSAAAPASAHAELESTTPGDGSILRSAPTSVGLQFSEDVDVRPDGVRVVDADGTRVDKGKAESDGQGVDAPLERNLAEGSYLVSWRVVSADGHPVRGAFTFSVGKETKLQGGLASKAFSGSADRPYEIAGGVLRGFAYLGSLAAAGMVVFGGLLRRGDEPTPVTPLAGVLAGVGLAGVLLQIPVQASLATGEGVLAVKEPGVFALAITDGVGWASLVTLLGLVSIIVTVGLPFKAIPRAVAVVGALLTPLGFAITGHTRTMSPALVGYVADVVHLLAAAAWIGGLIALVGVVRLRQAEGDEHGAAEAVARFSGWAALVLLGVIAGGTALGWIEVGGWKALTTTTYGKVLLVKVGLVGVVALGAAWNRFRLVPLARAAEADDDPSVRSWQTVVTIVRMEILGLVAVMGLTAALVNITPAKTAVTHGPVSASAALGSGRVDVTIDPARPGRNDVHIYILDKTGKPLGRYRAAEVTFSLKALGLGPLARTPHYEGNGHFLLVATELSPAGQWSMTITVKPDRFTEQKATVRFAIS